MSSMTEAKYRIEFFDVDGDELKKAVDTLLDQKEIILEKVRKEKVKMIDIRPLIYHLEVMEQPLTLEMDISHGSVDNLKPELVLQALGEKFKNAKRRIIRVDMYAQNHQSLNDFGEDI